MHQQKAAPGAGDAEGQRFSSVDAERNLLSPNATGSPAKRARDQNVAAVLELLVETWPKCFSIYEARRRPLKIGIHNDIVAALDGAVTSAELSRALGAYTANAVYRSRLRAGAVRIGLDGEPAGEVSEDEACGGPKLAGHKTAAKPPKEIPKPQRLGLADLKRAALQRKAVAS